MAASNTVFVKPRTRSASHGVDIMAHIKNAVGSAAEKLANADDAYQRYHDIQNQIDNMISVSATTSALSYEKMTGHKLTNTELNNLRLKARTDILSQKPDDSMYTYGEVLKNAQGEYNKALRKGSRNRWAAAYAIKTVSNFVKDATELVLDNVGTFTDNTAYQNVISNAKLVTNKLISGVSSIASGAMAGGAWGAAIAAIAVTANEALSMASTAINITKNNAINAAAAVKSRERLGYIETGYSR